MAQTNYLSHLEQPAFDPTSVNLRTITAALVPQFAALGALSWTKGGTFNQVKPVQSLSAQFTTGRASLVLGAPFVFAHAYLRSR